MKEVPNIISTKDLSYIKDMIKWNLVLSKKARMYKSEATNSDVKSFFSDVSKLHSAHYKTLLGLLE